MIEEEKQELSNEALFSAEQQLKKVRRVQLSWSLLTIGIIIAFLVLISFSAMSPPKRSFIDDLPDNSILIILIVGFFSFILLSLLEGKHVKRVIGKYIAQGLVEEQNPVYGIKPCHTGRGYLFLREDRFIYIDNPKKEIHKEIKYEDVQLVLYEELPRTPRLPTRELLICLYTHNESYVFSTVGRIIKNVPIVSVTPSSMTNPAPLLDGRAFLGDIGSAGIKTYISRLGVPYWLSSSFLPVIVIPLLMGIVVIAVLVLDFILS